LPGRQVEATVAGMSSPARRDHAWAVSPRKERVPMSEAVPAKVGLASANGIALGYQVYGSGKPLVLLHGGFGSVEMFGPSEHGVLSTKEGQSGRGERRRAAATDLDVPASLHLEIEVTGADRWVGRSTA
jgi:hypothetical protein